MVLLPPYRRLGVLESHVISLLQLTTKFQNMTQVSLESSCHSLSWMLLTWSFILVHCGSIALKITIRSTRRGRKSEAEFSFTFSPVYLVFSEVILLFTFLRQILGLLYDSSASLQIWSLIFFALSYRQWCADRSFFWARGQSYIVMMKHSFLCIGSIHLHHVILLMYQPAIQRPFLFLWRWCLGQLARTLTILLDTYTIFH